MSAEERVRPTILRVGTVRRTVDGWCIEGWTIVGRAGDLPYSGDELREIARAAGRLVDDGPIDVWTEKTP